MIEELPTYINLLFGATVILSIGWFYWAVRSKTCLLLIIGWTILQSVIGLQGFYQDLEAMPPKIMLFGILPTLILITIIFFNKRGKNFIDKFNLKTLTYFHSIRIPVEIVLALLFHHKLVSVYMTYEGTNFDMFSGVTAALIAYIAFRNNIVNKKLLIAWNILCLFLLLNVVITAFFAFPTPFQKLAFDQPNIAILYFPFNLLPTVIVPMVLFGHLAAIRQLKK